MVAAEPSRRPSILRLKSALLRKSSRKEVSAVESTHAHAAADSSAAAAGAPLRQSSALRRKSSSHKLSSKDLNAVHALHAELEAMRESALQAEIRAMEAKIQAEASQQLLSHVIWRGGTLEGMSPAQALQSVTQLQRGGDLAGVSQAQLQLLATPQTPRDALRWSRSAGAAAALRYPKVALGCCPIEDITMGATRRSLEEEFSLSSTVKGDELASSQSSSASASFKSRVGGS